MSQDEELTMAGLSGELHVPIRIEVTVEPRVPEKKKPKTKGKKQPKGKVHRPYHRNDFDGLDWDRYKIDCTANILGKVYKQIWRNIPINYVNSTKEEFEARVEHFVATIYAIKKQGQKEVINTTVKVDLPK